LLAEDFMRRFGRKHGVHVRGFSEDGLRVMRAHSWPGNVRELQNVVERAVILCGESGVLEPEHLGLALGGAMSPAGATAGNSEAGSDLATLAELEKRHILAMVNHCKGNRTQAAKMLGVSIRTLRNKLHEYDGTGPLAEEE